jgi:hypothetical protein
MSGRSWALPLAQLPDARWESHLCHIAAAISLLKPTPLVLSSRNRGSAAIGAIFAA